jgi:DNA polymerase I-like protein with 3'-5' exonuclease and polymerase domains
MPAESKQHLKDKGITNLSDFTDHIRQIENKFWKEKFPVYAEWKKETYFIYEKKGYVDLLTGFRCYGPIKKNKVLNYRIQGTAFHCLLWTCMQVTREVQQKKNSFLIGQIHDSMIGDIHPDDEEEIDRIVIDYGTKKIREHWDWVIVPLTLEKERSEINGNWSEMKGVEI